MQSTKVGLLHTACSRNPTYIRNSDYRPTCSYRLARPVPMQTSEQARLPERTQMNPVHKSGLLRTTCSRNPTYIRNSDYRPTCSYRLARPVPMQTSEQARLPALTLTGLLWIC